MSRHHVHPLLLRAKALCEEFAVRPGKGGFVVWRCRDWSHERPGWRREAAVKAREDAEADLLKRFNLAESDAPEPRQIVFVPAVIVPYDDDLGDCGWQ
jgi:hypothetical protein